MPNKVSRKKILVGLPVRDDGVSALLLLKKKYGWLYFG